MQVQFVIWLTVLSFFKFNFGACSGDSEFKSFFDYILGDDSSSSEEESESIKILSDLQNAIQKDLTEIPKIVSYLVNLTETVKDVHIEVSKPSAAHPPNKDLRHRQTPDLHLISPSDQLQQTSSSDSDILEINESLKRLAKRVEHLEEIKSKRTSETSGKGKIKEKDSQFVQDTAFITKNIEKPEKVDQKGNATAEAGVGSDAAAEEGVEDAASTERDVEDDEQVEPPKI